MKTYLTVASHWSVPGIRQYASQDREAAERKATEIVESLRSEWVLWTNRSSSQEELLPAIGPDADWEDVLAALQLARLIEVHGGIGLANDALADFCAGSGREAPMEIEEIGEVPAALRNVIEAYVEEDSTEPGCEGYPMVWIEEVDGTDATETTLDRARRLYAQLALIEAGRDPAKRTERAVSLLADALDAAAHRAQPGSHVITVLIGEDEDRDAAFESDDNCPGCGEPVGEEHGEGCDEAAEPQFLNKYRCTRCEHTWEDQWSSTCDDDCPSCGARHMSPYESEEL